MKVLPYKRAHRATACAVPARALGSHQGRVVGALAGLLSCVPGCPTPCGFLFSLGAPICRPDSSLHPGPAPSTLFLLVLFLKQVFFLFLASPLQARRCGCTDKTSDGGCLGVGREGHPWDQSWVCWESGLVP